VKQDSTECGPSTPHSTQGRTKSPSVLVSQARIHRPEECWARESVKLVLSCV
jgi:hypothetical protein